MIQLEQVSKTYRSAQHTTSVALKPTSLSIPSKQIFGVIGESGAGKSTLLRLMNGLEQPSSGAVWVEGKNLTTLSANELRHLRSKIGMIFQHFHLVGAKTVFENVAMPLQWNGISRDAIKKRVNELLDRVGLTPFAHQYATQLSGGQKQRVAIARALANQPSILLSDEATSSLDPANTQQILSLLHSLRDDLGLTIVLITHEMEVIKSICDRVAVMAEGTIVEEGAVLDIFTQPQHAFTRKLVTASMGGDLPQYWMNRLVKQSESKQERPLLHLTFRDKTATQPIIAELVQQCGVSINILQAHLENLQGHTCGSMIVSIAQADKCEAVVEYLKAQAVGVEVLGYVALD